MSDVVFPVVIIAGGMATRLRPLTETIPKALVDINGEPFIAHQLRLLRVRGISRVVICAAHLGAMIQEYVGDGRQLGLQVEFVFDGPQLLGTAGAIKQALPLLDTGFFVLYGDSYLPCNYYAVQQAFLQSQKLALMTVFPNDNAWDTSNVEYVDDRILTYDKQNRTVHMRHIDYGLGVFQPAAFERVPPQTAYDLALLYQQLLRCGELAAYEVKQRFYEIGSFNGLEETRRYMTTQPLNTERAPS